MKVNKLCKKKRNWNPLNWIKNFVGTLKGYSGCSRCGDSWWWKQSHIIQLTGGGIFPLCEECWNEIESKEKRFWILDLESQWSLSGPSDERSRAKIREALELFE